MHVCFAPSGLRLPTPVRSAMQQGVVRVFRAGKLGPGRASTCPAPVHAALPCLLNARHASGAVAPCDVLGSLRVPYVSGLQGP